MHPVTQSFYCEHKVVSNAIQLYISDRLTSPHSQHFILSVRFLRQCCLRSKSPTACSWSVFPGCSPLNCFGNCEGQDSCWLFSGLDQLPRVIQCWWEQHHRAPAWLSGHPLSKMAPEGPVPFQAGCGPPTLSLHTSAQCLEVSNPWSGITAVIRSSGISCPKMFCWAFSSGKGKRKK